MGRARVCVWFCLLVALSASAQGSAQKPVDERWEQALALYAEGLDRAPEIVNLLQGILEEEPEHRSALRLLGLTFLGNARADLALPRFEELIRIAAEQERIFPGDHFWQAMCLNRLGRNEEARQVIGAYAGFLDSAEPMHEEPLVTEYADLKARLADSRCTPEIKGGSYERPCSGLVVKIPEGLRLSAEYVEGDSLEAVFRFPAAWSEKKQESVVNAAAVHAYRKPYIRSLKELVRHEFRNRKDSGHRLISKKKAEARAGRAFVTEEEWGGLRYKSLTHFRYENGTGYVLIFSSTPGTYDRNLPVFDAFLKGIATGPPAAPAGN